jgi:hypothetical protein
MHLGSSILAPAPDSCQALFFPCNIDQIHWILIVAFMEEKTIQVFNSTFKSYRYSVIAIFNYLKDAYRATHDGVELPDQRQWKLYKTPPIVLARRTVMTVVSSCACMQIILSMVGLWYLTNCISTIVESTLI